jgi:hypothetical protein
VASSGARRIEALRQADAAVAFSSGHGLTDIRARVHDTLARLAQEER